MSAWTEEEDTILAERWAAGDSARACALHLHSLGFPKRSRNSAIGRIHRKGLPKRAEVLNSTAGVVQSTRRARKRCDLRKHPVTIESIRHKALPAFAPDVEPLNIPLEALTWGVCRAVTLTNEWGKPRYCGHSCDETASFCAPHAARFYQPIKPPAPRAPYDRSRLRAAEAHL